MKKVYAVNLDTLTNHELQARYKMLIVYLNLQAVRD